MIGFALIGGIDGIYYHLYKFKLYAHPESRYEHILHSIRFLLIAPIIYILFVRNFSGTLLWLGLVLVILDLLILTLDIYSEDSSRQQWGGLPRTEYYLHIMANGMHFASLAMILAVKPAAVWGIGNILPEPTYPDFTTSVGEAIIPFAVLSFLSHIWLYFFPGSLVKKTEQGVEDTRVSEAMTKKIVEDARRHRRDVESEG